MSTELQRKAVNELVEDGRNIGKAMIRAGYSPNTAKAPTKLTKSKGFKEICEQCGLTDDLILNSLVEDIKKKPQNRKPELELGAKIKGMMVERSEIEVTLPQPIMEIDDIPQDNSDKEDSETKETD